MSWTQEEKRATKMELENSIRALEVRDETSLAGVLASISSLGDSHARNLLLRGLPRTVCSDIGRTSAPSTDLYNIVEAVEGFGRLADGRIAINVVIDNAMKYARNTTKVHQLAMFYVEEK